MDIEPDVIARVAAKASLEVSGVVTLENAFTDGIVAALGRDGRTKGVRVVTEEGGCGFQISAVTKYGCNIPEIAWNLQEHVKKTVEKVIGVRVLRVDVLIAGIRDTARPRMGGARESAAPCASSMPRASAMPRESAAPRASSMPSDTAGPPE